MRQPNQLILIPALVSLAISIVTVSLRCFVRSIIVKCFGWDDVLIVLAVLFNTVFSLCGIIGAFHGLGQKGQDLSANDMKTGLMLWLLGALFYALTCTAAKTSIAMSLLRLAITKFHKIALWSVIVWTIIDGTVSWFFLLLECHPVSYFWNKDQTGSCLGPDFLIYITYIYSVGAFITDTIIAILPVAIIWRLTMTRRLKVLLAILLGMGWIACIAVAARIPFVHTYRDPDFLYATTQISVCSNIETGLGIAAGSLMTIRPLIRYLNLGGSLNARRNRGAVVRSQSTEHLHGERRKSETIHLHEELV